MKKLLLLLATITCVYSANAQSYKDSLYQQYVLAYWEALMSETNVTVLLSNTAEKVFSVDDPVMRYAIKESGMEDSTAISILGKEAVACFLDGKLISWTCVHYTSDMLPIVKTYADELCTRVTGIMAAKGKVAASALVEVVEQATTDGSISMAKDQKFAAKAAKLREEHGVDKLIHALECNLPYMYVNCRYMREYVQEVSVGKAVAKFVAYKNSERLRMAEAVKYYILTGNTDTLRAFVARKAVIKDIEGSLKPVSKKVQEEQTKYTSLLYRFRNDGDKLDLSYVLAGREPTIVGGVLLDIAWKDFKWVINGSSPIAAKEIKGKDVLMGMGKVVEGK